MKMYLYVAFVSLVLDILLLCLGSLKVKPPSECRSSTSVTPSWAAAFWVCRTPCPTQASSSFCECPKGLPAAIQNVTGPAVKCTVSLCIYVCIFLTGFCWHALRVCPVIPSTCCCVVPELWVRWDKCQTMWHSYSSSPLLFPAWVLTSRVTAHFRDPSLRAARSEGLRTPRKDISRCHHNTA